MCIRDSDEVGRQPDEGPLHDVTFAKPFAISRYQVTAGELDAYLKATGVKLADGDTRPGRECIAGKPRYQQGPRQPAVCVDYNDVKNYAAWLSKKTGKHYRMLSEAEREYGARAGSAGPFPFPFDEGKEYSIAKHANTYGASDGYNFTSPVGSFPPNAFGVYDMHGNVDVYKRQGRRPERACRANCSAAVPISPTPKRNWPRPRPTCRWRARRCSPS